MRAARLLSSKSRLFHLRQDVAVGRNAHLRVFLSHIFASSYSIVKSSQGRIFVTKHHEYFPGISEFGNLTFNRSHTCQRRPDLATCCQIELENRAEVRFLAKPRIDKGLFRYHGQDVSLNSRSQNPCTPDVAYRFDMLTPICCLL